MKTQTLKSDFRTQDFDSRSLGLDLLSGHWLYVPSVFRSQVNRIMVIKPKNAMTKIMAKYG